jgi:hypothetical protein
MPSAIASRMAGSTGAVAGGDTTVSGNSSTWSIKGSGCPSLIAG